MAYRPATFRYTETGTFDYIAMPPGHKAWNFELSGPAGASVTFRIETTNVRHATPLVQRTMTLDDTTKVEGLVTEEAFKMARVVITDLTGANAALLGSVAFQ